MDRYSFIVRDLHSLLLAGLPALRITSPLYPKQPTYELTLQEVCVGPTCDIREMRGPQPRAPRMATLLIRFRPLAFLTIGQLLVFERHALQFTSHLRFGRKLRLLTAQQFERAIGEVGTGEWLMRFAARECVRSRRFKNFAPLGNGLAHP